MAGLPTTPHTCSDATPVALVTPVITIYTPCTFTYITTKRSIITNGITTNGTTKTSHH